jgi:hypothetical protein
MRAVKTVYGRLLSSLFRRRAVTRTPVAPPTPAALLDRALEEDRVEPRPRADALAPVLAGAQV